MPMLNLDNSSLYYSVKGEGVPIVFIHPPLLTGTNFIYQIEELSKKYKVITFDIRGHGQSPYSNQALTYRLISDDIRNLLDHLEIERAFICGYSTGGSITLEYLLTYPDRALGGIVISGMSEVTDWFLKQKISLAIKLAKEKTLPVLSLSISWGNSNSRKLFRELHREAIKGDARNIKQYYQYSLHYNCTSQLQNIAHPILLVYGSKDKSFHQYANLLHEKLSCTKLIFFENEKHQLPTKASKKLNEAILQFIQSEK